MTDRAGVRAESTMVRPGDAELTRITGAQEPSGEPVPEIVERPRRSNGPRPYADRGQAGRPRRNFDRDRGGSGNFHGRRPRREQRAG